MIKRVITLIITCLFAMTALTGCANANKQTFENAEMTNAQALKQTKYVRSSFYTDPYPTIDIDQLSRLPVYYFSDYNSNTARQKIADFSETLHTDDQIINENINSVSAVFTDDELYNNTLTSELFAYAVSDIEYSYDPESDTIELDEQCKQNIINACEKLSSIFGYDIYNSFYIRREQIYNQNDVLNADFSVIISFGNNGINSELDKLLNYYDLSDKLEIRIQVSDGACRKLTVTKFDTDCLVKVADYDITPIGKAFDRYPPITEPVYIVYVKDDNGFIRPVYTDQDYYKLGSFDNCQYADALIY